MRLAKKQHLRQPVRCLNPVWLTTTLKLGISILHTHNWEIIVIGFITWQEIISVQCEIDHMTKPTNYLQLWSIFISASIYSHVDMLFLSSYWNPQRTFFSFFSFFINNKTSRSLVSIIWENLYVLFFMTIKLICIKNGKY